MKRSPGAACKRCCARDSVQRLDQRATAQSYHGWTRRLRGQPHQHEQSHTRPQLRPSPARSLHHEGNEVGNLEVSRRLLLASGSAAVAISAHAPPAAGAAVTLQNQRGEDFLAYELPFTLNIVATEASITPQAILAFQSQYRKYAGLKVGFRRSTEAIYEELVKGPSATEAAGSSGKPVSAAAADLVSLGDRWLGPAVQNDLLRPFLDAEAYRYWDQLTPAWQQLVRRDVRGRARADGKSGLRVWGVPYRWRCSVVAYRTDHFRQRGIKPIQDWHDLLQPKLAGRVAFTNSARELVSIALKSLGLRFNATPADLRACGVSRRQVVDRVRALRAQARVFSDTQHVASLYGGDAWVAVGASDDVLAVAARSAKMTVVAPASGTMLTADLWTQPRHMREPQASPLAPLWMEQFVYPPAEGSRLGLQLGFRPHQLHAARPTSGDLCRAGFWEGDAGGAAAQVLTTMSQLDAAVQRGCEFLLPLSDDAREVYQAALEEAGAQA